MATPPPPLLLLLLLLAKPRLLLPSSSCRSWPASAFVTSAPVEWKEQELSDRNEEYAGEVEAVADDAALTTATGGSTVRGEEGKRGAAAEPRPPSRKVGTGVGEGSEGADPTAAAFGMVVGMVVGIAGSKPPPPPSTPSTRCLWLPTTVSNPSVVPRRNVLSATPSRLLSLPPLLSKSSPSSDKGPPLLPEQAVSAWLGIKRLMPKSVSFTTHLSSITKFEHFTSRCTMGGDCECRKSKPRAACSAQFKITS
mmetsp:Transcript_56973/g.112471  ORF Transcript_56973/g.112471 Transcript_56973/m.112471 type:complete len:252 (+) Transcript_56973:104-859(+)